MKNEEEKILDDYFGEVVEYPDDMALDILPWGVLWNYVSSSFLNGFINYVTPIKAYVLGRYKGWDEQIERKVRFQDPPHSRLIWRDFVGTKAELLELAKEEGRFYHTKLNMFDDDMLILARAGKNEAIDQVPAAYYYFWFDRDVSDCCIGRFLTRWDSEEEVINAFKKKIVWLDKDGGSPYGARELHIVALQGWLEF